MSRGDAGVGGDRASITRSPVTSRCSQANRCSGVWVSSYPRIVTDPADQQLTLHSGWLGIVLSYLGAFAVLIAGFVSVMGSGGAAVSLVVLVIGALLFGGVLVDYPIASTFSAHGVQRRPLRRRHLFPWGSFMISRARPSLRVVQCEVVPGRARRSRRQTAVPAGRPRRVGGQFDRLETLCRAWGIEVNLGMRPADTVTPTWLYRRKRWAPNDVV